MLAERRLATMIGTRDGVTRAWIAPRPGERCKIDMDRCDLPLWSIAAQVPAASWYEREIKDMFGFEFGGSPDSRPLVIADGDCVPFPQAAGEGVFEIPVGPIHAGVIESGHFRFFSVGEKTLHLEPRLFYKHRGIERMVEGMPFDRGLKIAERIAGDETVANGIAYCRAVEHVSGSAVPARGEALRLIFLELERVHSLLNDISLIGMDIAFEIGGMLAAKLREETLRTAAGLTGSRFMRGALALGGVAIDLDSSQTLGLVDFVRDLRPRIGRLQELVLDNTSVIDRLDGAGILEHRHAVALGVVGPAARASGVFFDARRDLALPLGFAPEVSKLLDGIPVATRVAGDCLARTELRFDELNVSLDLIENMAVTLPGGTVCAVVPPALPPSAFAIGAAEAARGESLHFVMTSEDGAAIRRYKPRPPSRCNWPALPIAFAGDIVPDFPLVNKSFNLSFAGNDL